MQFECIWEIRAGEMSGFGQSHVEPTSLLDPVGLLGIFGKLPFPNQGENEGMGLWDLAGSSWVMLLSVRQLTLQMLSYGLYWAPLTAALVTHMVAASRGFQASEEIWEAIERSPRRRRSPGELGWHE